MFNKSDAKVKVFMISTAQMNFFCAIPSRLFHLSFELGVQCLYACQCGMGENTILIDISRGGGLYGVFKPIAQRSLILAEADISLRKTSAKADIRSAIFSLSML